MNKEKNSLFIFTSVPEQIKVEIHEHEHDTISRHHSRTSNLHKLTKYYGDTWHIYNFRPYSQLYIYHSQQSTINSKCQPSTNIRVDAGALLSKKKRMIRTIASTLILDSTFLIWVFCSPYYPSRSTLSMCVTIVKVLILDVTRPTCKWVFTCDVLVLSQNNIDTIRDLSTVP